MEIYRKIRPTSFKRVVGQDRAVKILRGFLARKEGPPHVFMLHGPSGTGKTTLARIMAKTLGCDVDSGDYIEINVADFNGIETARSIAEVVPIRPMHSCCRVWNLDEVQAMSGQAQQAFMKVLEEAPEWAFFFFGTTDPDRIITALKGRCQMIQLDPLDDGDLKLILDRAVSKLGLDEIEGSELEALIEAADGSARKALQILEQIAQLPPGERLDAIETQDSKKQAIDIARAVMERKASWKKVATMLKACEEDAEKIRQIILTYCGSCLLNDYLSKRCSLLIELLGEPWYHAKGKSMSALLYNALYTALNTKD
jgi:DNA polymerase III gamma/tau subunit